MSKNLDQVYVANPITSNASTDLMYFMQSPYTPGTDAAMTYANFAAQFAPVYTPSALTSGNDTNVTLTLGGTPATALLQAASITAGWTGTLSLARGGSATNLTASNGGIVYSTASTMAILSGTATANQLLFSGSSTAPVWSTSTYPATNAANTLLYASSANTMAALSTSNSGVLITSAGGVPSISTTLPSGLTIPGYQASLTLPLSLSNGGTNANLIASNGGIFYSGGSAGAILSGTATANQLLLSGSSTTPAWSTSTYPATNAINTLLYASAANTMSALATATTAVLTTASGVPTWAAELSLGLGGTNAALVATNGAVVYCGASALGLSAGAGANNVILLGQFHSSPTWSTSTYPATNAVNTLLYASAANTMSALATVNSAVLTTSSGGVPTWATELPLSLGGTNANLTANNGGIFYSTASAGAILAGTATAGQLLTSGASTTPAWTTTTYPATNAISTLLYASAANVMSALATANNGILITSGTGVPSISSTLPNAVLANITKPTRQLFVSGSGTYTTPANCLWIRVRGVGAGGAGGGCASSAAAGGAGAGGGGGGYFETTIVSPSASYPYAVGTGGTVGTAGNNPGNNGGNTTFGTGGSLMTANGGAGGNGSGASSTAAFSTYGGAATTTCAKSSSPWSSPTGSASASPPRPRRRRGSTSERRPATSGCSGTRPTVRRPGRYDHVSRGDPSPGGGRHDRHRSLGHHPQPRAGDLRRRRDRHRRRRHR